MQDRGSRGVWKSGILLSLMFLVLITTSGYAIGPKVDLSSAVVVYNSSESHQEAAAKLLQHEVEIRAGIKLSLSTEMPSDDSAAIVVGSVGTFPISYELPTGLCVPTKSEGYAIWVDTAVRSAPTVYLVGNDDRGALFAVGRLMRNLYLSDGYISLATDIQLAKAPADRIRAQQIINSTQSKDGFVNWKDAASTQQHVRDMVLFGTNGFEARAPKHVDVLMEELGVDFYHKITCQQIIDYYELSDEEIKSKYNDLVGIDHITTYGGDASGSRPPQFVFPKAERVIPLIIEGLGGKVKWWYSNQCLDDHAKDYDDYIFDYFKSNRPSWLYGMVYGPWSKRGLTEIRDDLPAQYEIRHYPEICHVRWCQYPVPKWDRAWASVWPRNRSIYMMPTMIMQMHRATREKTMGFLPYNHIGSFNDLNKFALTTAGWDPDIETADLLNDYARAFFAYNFKHNGSDIDAVIDVATAEVAKGLMLLEQNWVGPLKDNKSTEEALKIWKDIAKRVGGPDKNWRVEMFLYKARLDAQVKRKYDFEMMYEKQAYNVLKGARRDISRAVKEVRSLLAKVDSEFQSKEAFKKELLDLGLSGKYGNLDEVVDNIYSPLSDRLWIEAQLAKATTVADIKKIAEYEDAGEGGFYDNLGVFGEDPHLVRQKTWDQDPGFVYSPIEWVDDKSGSDLRHSQLTHAVCRYNTPLIMRWDELDPYATYHMEVVYRGPFGPEFTCRTDEGLLVHGVRGGTDAEPVSYKIPAAATRDGVLELKWELKNIVRGVSVTEIWLIKD